MIPHLLPLWFLTVSPNLALDDWLCDSPNRATALHLPKESESLHQKVVEAQIPALSTTHKSPTLLGVTRNGEEREQGSCPTLFDCSTWRKWLFLKLLEPLVRKLLMKPLQRWKMPNSYRLVISFAMKNTSRAFQDLSVCSLKSSVLQDFQVILRPPKHILGKA